MASPSEEIVEPVKKYPLWKQERVEAFYNSDPIQVLVAVVIGLNFATNIVEKQVDPYGDEHDDIFGVFEYIYNILFTIELGVNMYGHWWCPFWQSGWNVFDFVVVSIGVINTVKLPLPKAFSLLRMMRAFRVFRLFKRVKSLNKIIVAIIHAVPGVCNAFLILAIVMSIYAILAVEFYQDVGQFCQDPTSEDRWWKTARGLCMGEEYFGSFSKSLYTFFQVLTGESWSEMVARPAIWYYIRDPILAVGSGLFFVSYILVSSFVLTNVVVAVLLDKMACDPEVAQQAIEADPDSVAGANGVDGAANAEAQATSLLEDSRLEAITGTVQKLTAVSSSMRTDLDTSRKDLAALREQIETVLRLVQSTV